MVDNLNPTNQFHPYQPIKDTPQVERSESGPGNMLKRSWRRAQKAWKAAAKRGMPRSRMMRD